MEDCFIPNKRLIRVEKEIEIYLGNGGLNGRAVNKIRISIRIITKNSNHVPVSGRVARRQLSTPASRQTLL